MQCTCPETKIYACLLLVLYYYYYYHGTHGITLQLNTCIATLQFEQALGAHSEWYTKLRLGSEWLHMCDLATIKCLSCSK